MTEGGIVEKGKRVIEALAEEFEGGHYLTAFDTTTGEGFFFRVGQEGPVEVSFRVSDAAREEGRGREWRARN